MVRLLALLLLIGGLAAIEPARASTGPAQVAIADAPGAGAPFDLSDDVVEPPAERASQRLRRWPGRTIRYHETIPAKWDWSLDQAIQHWNQAGGRIRFVETSSAKARLRISYGETGGADGVGTLGYQHTNYVHLSPTYKRADEHRAETRVWVGRLFTHELGHVLGFNHTRGQCSLMYPYYDFGLCPPLPDDAPGYYNCRWIDRSLLRRFIAKYGGHARRPPAYCLIEALPGALRDVRFEGGESAAAPVRITWQPPATVRSGTKVWVTVWSAASCAKAPTTWERRVGVDPRVGSWADPGYGQGMWCYRVEIVNRYGAARPPDVQRIERWAPVPDPPTPAPPTWLADDGAWRFTRAAPSGTELAVVRNAADPATCPTGTDGWSTLDRESSDRWILYADAPTECVLLVAVTQWGTVSAGTPVHLSAPGVTTAPQVGTPVWQPGRSAFVVTWTPPDARTHLEVVRTFGGDGSCPAAYDESSASWVDDDGPGRWIVDAYAARECVAFFAVTTWGGVSPGRTVQLQVPAPTMVPTVGSVTYDPESRSATLPASLASDQYRLGIELVAGTCPGQPPGNADWWDGYEGQPGLWTVYPDYDGPQCVLVAAIDGFGQHGPVVTRTFTAG